MPSPSGHALREHGFALAGLPPVPAVVAAGFGEDPGRVLRLRMSWTADDDWLFQYVPAPAAAGPANPVRDLADRRLAAGLSALLRRTLSGPWLDIHADWLIELHRIRTVAPAGAAVRVEPPGPAPAGCAFTLVAVAGREGAGSLRSLLYGPGRGAPPVEAAPAPGQGVLLDRRAVVHDRHELLAGSGGPVVQDLLLAHLCPAAGPVQTAPGPALRRRPMLVRGPAGTVVRTRPALR
ncbi:hypothetical protein ABZZ17_26315 [Streptomyces sp. NPDC006512]|uniref:hypothetical protein n=1 Tax=Streptomyces sp. NPDC006512 TaxID=3154307 RepID=UPI0033AC7F73